MASDLIRKSRTLELLKYYERQYDGIGRAIRAFEQMETVDAVEVVRCKDCKRFEKHEDRNIYYCKRFLCGVSANDFCSSGAKMDGGENDEN